MMQETLGNILDLSAMSQGGIVRAPQKKLLQHKNSLDFADKWFPKIKLTLFELEKPAQDKWHDVFYVTDCTKKDSNKMHVGAILALTHSSAELELEAAVYDKESQKKIEELAPIVKTNTAIVEMNEIISIPQGYENKELICLVKGGYKDATGNHHEISKPVALSLDIKDYIEYRHIRPVKETGGCVFIGSGIATYRSGAYVGNVNDKIVISYLRTPDDINDCDYVCNFKRGFGTDHPIVGIPFHAVLGLKQKGCFAEPVVGHGWILRMDADNSGGKILTYEDQTDHTYGSEGDEKIEIEEQQGWGVVYEEEGGMKPTDFHFYYDMQISILSQSGQTSVPMSWNTVVTSDPSQNDCLYSEIKPLRIMWGCLARDTLVIMADGSQKAIQDIRTGDFVLTEDGSASVRNCWSGPGENMLRITIENHHSLLLTADHPVFTDSGWKKASELTAGNLLIFAEEAENYSTSKQKVTQIEPSTKETKTYNLSLEGTAHGFFAEGILVGDMDRENGLV